MTQTAAEFAQVQGAFRNTRVVSDVALLHDYESRWAINWQIHTSRYDAFNMLKTYYQTIRKISQSLDVVSPDVPLDQYKLVVAPGLSLIPKERAAHLADYVKNGGHLVLGPRSGMKNEFNALLPLRQPGYLIEALGGRVEQFYALERDTPVSGSLGSGTATIWAEQLKAMAPDAEVLLRYGGSNGWLDGQPCVITHPFGRGRITYIAAILDPNLMTALAQWMVNVSGVNPVFGPVPDGIEVNRRVGPGSTVFVLVNFNPEKQIVPLPRPMKSILHQLDPPDEPQLSQLNTAQAEVTEVELSRYGVAILLDQRKP
ncbi:MAG: beta-galactosidase trimerization domain-containing protein [Acidobacteria bacterium Pan2503]|uniref:Beta-galactosidase trimerization domain-containing protein n=1 Tax=Candidatus Acidiferrum panamense TaxID=2741543 RepID=A0A7V8NWF0_9BACT|nr:beta-galactosidase trimerization domain-containing protein [Candidatus Acidoferrum panamensis]